MHHHPRLVTLALLTRPQAPSYVGEHVCVCVLGLGTLPQTPHELIGSPEVVPMPPASGHGLLTPQLMPQGLPTPCSVLPVRVGRSKVCVCVCVCVCLGLWSPLRTWCPPTRFKPAFKWLGVGFARLHPPEPGCTP